MSVFSLSCIDFHVRYMAPRKWGLSRGFVFHTNRMETWEEVRPGRLADVWLKCLKTESTNFMEGRRALARTLSLIHGVHHVCFCLIRKGLLFVKTIHTEMCLNRERGPRHGGLAKNRFGLLYAQISIVKEPPRSCFLQTPAHSCTFSWIIPLSV